MFINTKRKNSNFTEEKPSLHHLVQMVIVNLISHKAYQAHVTPDMPYD
jgi:hypothetical protein